MKRAVDILIKIAPRAKPSYLAAFDLGDELLKKFAVDTPKRLAHFLAQVLHETGGLRIDWENMNYSAKRMMEVFGVGNHSAAITPLEAAELAFNPPAIAERVYGLGNPKKAKELGNAQPGDGYLYRGGGLMQTTGRANYRHVAAKSGVDFVNTPELVVSPEHALKPALAEWAEKKLNQFADKDDLLSISKAINLGNPHASREPNGRRDRANWFNQVRPLVNGFDLDPSLQGSPIVVPPPEIAAGPVAITPPAAAIDSRREILQLKETLQTMVEQLSSFATEVTRTADELSQGEGRKAVPSGTAGGWKSLTDNVNLLAVDLTTRVSRIAAAPTAAVVGGELPSKGYSLVALLGDDMLEQGDSGEKVRRVQLALAKLGYALKGTGYFGGATDTAVYHFQQVHDLEVDGVVGPETAGALDRILGSKESRPKSDVEDIGRPLWLLEGLKWINTVEEAGADNNPAILEWARDEGGAIASYYRHDSVPWCALYANMILTKVGIKGTETLWALDWAKWGRALDGPAVGAFAPMKRNGGGHIAIVVGRDQHGNLMCLGGNQSDAVNIKPFPAERPLSFRWPHQVPLPSLVGLNRLPLVRSDGRVSRNEA